MFTFKERYSLAKF
jgi:hypothetical protein